MITTFKELWVSLSPTEKQELASKSGISVAYLSQVANGHRGAGVKTIGKLLAADKRISYGMFFDHEAA